MIRGIYTAASGMNAQQNRLDALSNNLANVDRTAFKRDFAVHKAFPEMLIRRFDDNGVFNFPMGSVDTTPVVGKLGTGVEVNEIFTSFGQGSLKETGNDFDLALTGTKGFFTVETPYGERYTRNGSFTIGPESLLVTEEGYPVLGEKGHIKLQENNFRVDKMGRIFVNPRYSDTDVVTQRENSWEEEIQLDSLKMADFEDYRYLEKQGDSLWKDTIYSGSAAALTVKSEVLQGYLETSNVNPVREMVDMIEVNRAYEANQKVVQAHDGLLDKLINDVSRV